MISTDKNKGKNIKAIRAAEEKVTEQALREKCEKWAVQRFTEQKVKEWSNTHKGLWYLPILDDEENIEACLILMPINRHILSYASTKLTDDGLYIFLEQCLRDCYVEGDMKIIEEDEYFLPAANKFNKIMEGKKAAIVKR